MGNQLGKAELAKLQALMKPRSALQSLCGIVASSTEVDLSGLGMDAADVGVLAEEIKDKAALSSLNLASNSLGTEGAKVIAAALKVAERRIVRMSVRN